MPDTCSEDQQFLHLSRLLYASILLLAELFTIGADKSSFGGIGLFPQPQLLTRATLYIHSPVRNVVCDLTRIVSTIYGDGMKGGAN